MNSFVGEFTIMLGAFQLNWVYAVLAGGGVILAAWYMLRLHQGLMHEPPKPRTEGVHDLHIGEALLLAPLATVRANDFAVRANIDPYELTVFPDGRAIVKGTSDTGIARSLYARYVG